MSLVVRRLFFAHMNMAGFFLVVVLFSRTNAQFLVNFFFLFHFLFNVEQNVFLSCNSDGYALRTRYVLRNSKSSEFINQIGVFVFFFFFVSVRSAVSRFGCSFSLIRLPVYRTRFFEPLGVRNGVVVIQLDELREANVCCVVLCWHVRARFILFVHIFRTFFQ